MPKHKVHLSRAYASYDPKEVRFILKSNAHDYMGHDDEGEHFHATKGVLNRVLKYHGVTESILVDISRDDDDPLQEEEYSIT